MIGSFYGCDQVELSSDTERRMDYPIYVFCQNGTHGGISYLMMVSSLGCPLAAMITDSLKMDGGSDQSVSDSMDMVAGQEEGLALI